MANIKGITVEIGGDTTKLGKALEDVNKKSGSLSKELGEINRLLKFDPGNADLLAQKQRVLADAISNTSKKLDTLRAAEQQVQQQFERGEASEEQVRALQREIIATEKKLDSYGDAAKETADQVDKLGKESSGAKNGVDAVGDEAKETAKQFDDAGDKASNFGDALGKVAKSGAATCAAAIAALGAAVVAAGKAMVECSVGGAAYADTVLTESTVTGIATDKLQGYMYAAELVDVSTETLTKSMGKNIKSMKAVQDGTKLSVDAYKKLGVSVLNADGSLRDGETVYWETIDALGKMENETERDALAMQILGKSAQELNPLIEAGSGRMAELGEQAHAAGYVLSDETLEAFGAFDDQLQYLKVGATAAKNALGTVLLPLLTDLSKEGVKFLGEFTKGVADANGDINAIAGVISAQLPAVVSKILEYVPQVLNIVISIVTALGSALVSSAPMLVSAIMDILTTLITTFLAGLPQLITAGVQIIMALLTGITQAIPQITQALVEMIPQLVNALATGIPQLINGAVQLLLAIVMAIPQIIPPLVAAVPTITMALINGLLTAIPQLINGAVQFLMAIVQAIPTMLQSLLPQIPTIVETLVTGLLDNIPVLLDGAVQLLYAIIDAIPVIVAALSAAMPDIIFAIMDAVIASIPALLSAAVDLFMALVRAIPMILGALGSALASIWSAIQTYFSGLPPRLCSIGVTLFSSLAEAVPKVLGAIKSAISNIWSTISSYFSGRISEMMDVGKNLIEGLWNGISNMAGWIKDKISGFSEDVLSAIKDFFGIHSPSVVFRDDVGKQLALGLAEGIEENTDEATKASEKLAKDVLSAAEKRLANHKVYNEWLLADEVAYWDEVRNQIEEGTEARISADKKYFEAKKSLDDKIVTAEKTKTDKLKAAEESYREAVEATQEKIEARAKDIQSNMGSIFEQQTFEEPEVDLYANMRSQMESAQEWRYELEKLRARLGDTELYQEIAGKGIGAMKYVQEMNSWTDHKLANYQSMYDYRNSYAHLLAESDLADDTATELAAAETEYTDAINAANTEFINTCNELGGTVDMTVDKINTTAQAGLSALESSVTATHDAMESSALDALTFIASVEAKMSKLIPGIDGSALATSFMGTDSMLSGSSRPAFSDLIAGKLDRIYDRLSHLQVVLDSGALVGGTIDMIDAGLADRQLMSARGV